MRVRTAFLLGLAACGGSAGAIVGVDAGGGGGDGAAGDAGAAPDITVAADGAGADASEDGADGACFGFGCGLPDAGADATATDSTAPFIDAGCIDGGLPPGVGSQFTCGMQTCFSQSEYCAWSVGGLQMATRDPKVGFFSLGQCMPLPCSCGAVPTCDCLRATMVAPCFCMDEGGALGVQCNLP